MTGRADVRLALDLGDPPVEEGPLRLVVGEEQRRPVGGRRLGAVARAAARVSATTGDGQTRSSRS